MEAEKKSKLMRSQFSDIGVFLKVWKMFLQSRRDPLYQFSSEDRRLHLCERFWNSAQLENRGSQDGLLQLAVEGLQFYWPEGFASTDLGWLFSEVFYPRQVNPSSYEHPEITLSKTSWVIDAGACEGFFSLYALEKGASNIIAVEPLAQLKQSLEKTLRPYGAQAACRVISAGLGSGADSSYLTADPHHACEAHIADTQQGAGQKITLTTIDALADECGLTDNGFIKMDIEGSEMAALEGAALTLSLHRPKLAIAVYHGYENARLCRDIILRANAGYRIEFRGMYGWFTPPRPYMLFAY
jgi:FkbM family methyltransferase